MSQDCEVCGKPIAARCAGLDVPSLGFCSEHAEMHAKECLDVLAGRSWLNWIEAVDERAAKAGR